MPKKYTVEIDGVRESITAESLAEVCNKIRGKGKKFRIWAPSGLLILDTFGGDVYNLITK